MANAKKKCFARGGIVGFLDDREPVIRDYGSTPAESGFVDETGAPRGSSVTTNVDTLLSNARPSSMTFAERDRAMGLDPNRSYRPGGFGDPHASGVATRLTGARRNMGFSDGGMVQFHGRGGPREDKIPVRVAGEEIKVSDGEAAVILPAKTAANAAALGIIGRLIEATNDGRQPKMGIDDGEGYAVGAIPDDELRRSQGTIGGPSFVRKEDPPAVSQQAITAPKMYAQAYESLSRVPAAAGGIASSIAGALPEGGYLKDPAVREKVGRLIAGEGMFPPGAGITNAPQQNAWRPALASDPVRAKHNEILNSGAVAGTISLPITQPAKQAEIANTEAAQRAAAAEDSGAIMRNGIVSADMGRGFDPTRLTMAHGYGMATNASGKTISVSPGQYIAADGSPTSRWEDTQAYKDAIARNEADKMRLAEMQSRRLGADPMAIQTARQGIAGALLANRTQEAALQRNQYIQSLVAKAAAETDPVKQRAIIDTALAAQGKDSRHGKNLHVVDMGEYTEPDGIGGIKTVKRGQALYDADTKQVIPIQTGVPAGTTKSFATQEEAAAAQKAGKIKVGDVVTIGGRQFNVTPD
jgi:hypothetical protein